MYRPNVVAIVVSFLLMLSAVSSAQVYRWVDEKGQVHFSDKPTDRQQAEKVDIHTTPSSWQPLVTPCSGFLVLLVLSGTTPKGVRVRR